MGNTDPSSSKIRIHIDTDADFYNSGSTITGAVFVDVHSNFQFDALYIRIEGTDSFTKVRNIANGLRVPPRTDENLQATRTSTCRKKCSRGLIDLWCRINMCIPSQSRCHKIFQGPLFLISMMPTSNINWWPTMRTSTTTKKGITMKFRSLSDNPSGNKFQSSKERPEPNQLPSVALNKTK